MISLYEFGSPSIFIFRLFQENFNDYVNKYKVEYSKILHKAPKYDHLKTEAIATESGFNNKVKFYKAFTKFMNETPLKYRKAFAT